jgi:hypothetical protein
VSSSYTGADNAAGTFDSGDFGITEGILLTTGDVDNAVGPNNSGGSSAGNSGTGDSDLDSLVAPFTTDDAAILEITFVPAGELIEFNYVFGSEEYNEYVCSSFNDVFAFLVNGGEYENENIALIPGTDPALPVSIGTVNNGTVGTNGSSDNCSDEGLANSAFFVDNAAGANVEYDGYTTTLTASLEVVAGQEYTIKLAIADAGDSSFDSGVFLEAESFTSAVCDAGSLSLENFDTNDLEFCPDEETPSSLFVLNDGEGIDDTYIYVLTNEEGAILALPDTNEVDIDGLENGDYNIYGISYSGEFSGLEIGANISDLSADECIDLSEPIFLSLPEECFDCPELEANFGDDCDDEDNNTENDVVTEDCECAGEEPEESENTALTCSDGIDNDGDGLIDCEEPECQGLSNDQGCTTCFGDGLSFADAVLAYTNTCPNNTNTDSIDALGTPDGCSVSLGGG